MKSVLLEYRIISIAISLVVLVASCARMSSPTGGAKDEDPPVPLQSKPLNYSTNFDNKKIVIAFDEFIVLKNVRNELLISPPLPEKAEVKQRGKSMVIDLNNELKDSTTYNLNFYNSIEDLNEGNALKNFMFEFSTGDEFDSLYAGGFLKDAYNYKSEAGIYIMLYEKMNDSIPRKTIPNYVAKTDKEGQFFVSNLKNKSYYAFGLKDLNNNMMFDLPNEAIAFSDSTFTPGYKQITHTDTIHLIESISKGNQDTVFRDSIHIHNEWVTTIDNINLLFFQEDFEIQYFRDSYREQKEQVMFAFNKEVGSEFSIELLTEKPLALDWYIEEPQIKNDSIVLWLTDSLHYNQDSLYFKVNYIRQDSNQLDYLHTDTLLCYFEFSIEKSEDKKGDKTKKRLNLNNLFNDFEVDEKKEDEVIPSNLTFENNIGGNFELNKPIDLLAKYPIKTVKPSLITMHKVEDDTVLIPIDILFRKDSLQLRHYTIGFNKDEEEEFNILIPAGTFTDIYGNINDTISKKIRTKLLSDYSTLKLNVNQVFDNSVIQILNASEKIISETRIQSDTTLHFEYLKPQKVIIKIYYDSDNNGKWDTGNFKNGLQPETVFYFPQEIELIKNMDYEYNWDLYDN